jgi:predicted acetyltransferase
VPFLFQPGQRLTGTEVDLVVDRLVPADLAKKWQPAYDLRITLPGQNQKAGQVNLRLGYPENLVCYGGHLGYSVEPSFRGHRYAAKACELTRQIFTAHQMKVVWITCNPDNIASIRTCEILGCELVETVNLPNNLDMYEKGERQKHRYRWIIP